MSTFIQKVVVIVVNTLVRLTHGHFPRAQHIFFPYLHNNPEGVIKLSKQDNKKQGDVKVG